MLFRPIGIEDLAGVFEEPLRRSRIARTEERKLPDRCGTRAKYALCDDSSVTR